MNAPGGRVRALTVVLLAAVLLPTACRKPEAPLPGVRIAGCSALVEGPVCLLPAAPAVPARITLFVPAGPMDLLAVTTDGSDQDCAWTRIRDGVQCTVEIPGGSHALTVIGTGEGGRASWTHALGTEEPMPALADAASLRRAGRPDEAFAKLEAALALLPKAASGRALGLLARLELDRGRTDQAADRLRESIAQNAAWGRVSDAVSDAFALFFVLVEANRFREARAILDAAEARSGQFDEGLARLPYYRGILGYRTGNVRVALRSLASADDACERLGLERLRPSIRSLQALVLGDLGRRAEALALIRDTRLPADAGPCERGRLIETNLGWIALLEAEARANGAPASGPALDPGPALAAAAASLDIGCPPADRANARLNLAFGAIQRGDAVLASTFVSEARALFDDPGDAEQRSWRLDLEGRVLLAGGRGREALEAFERLARWAEVSGSEEATWRAAVGAGEARIALGQLPEAVVSFEAAEERLWHQSLAIPLDAGRGSFLGDRERSGRALVDALVRLDRPREAARAARRVRARVLASLARADALDRLPPAEQVRWDDVLARYRGERDALERAVAESLSLPADREAGARETLRNRAARVREALDDVAAVLPSFGARPVDPAPPDSGVLDLTFFPTRSGWLGFGSTSEGVTIRRIVSLPAPDAPPEVLSAALLGGFSNEIRKASLVRFLPYGPLRRVDFHALPWEGARLVDRVPVAYLMDLPPRPGRAPGTGSVGRLALVVADARNDLPGARREALAVAGALRAGGWAVEEKAGDAATAGSVRQALGRAGFLYYAGHGDFAGQAGADSALLLADGGTLTAGDLLSLDRVPEDVVLSGCDTALGSEEGGTEGLGVAQAFLVAGSRQVLATTRPIQDRSASSIAAAVFLPDGRPWDAAAAAARLAALEGPSGAGQAGFRALVR